MAVPESTPIRAAIYARVSTSEQSPELQLRDLREIPKHVASPLLSTLMRGIQERSRAAQLLTAS